MLQLKTQKGRNGIGLQATGEYFAEINLDKLCKLKEIVFKALIFTCDINKTMVEVFEAYVTKDVKVA